MTDDPFDVVEAQQFLRTRMSIRFALGICDDCNGSPELLASVMLDAFAGVASTAELAEKLQAFSEGITHLTGSPVPCAVSLEWATA